MGFRVTRYGVGCAFLATLGIACTAPTLNQTPPPIADDAESVVLLWSYEDARYAVAYDPRDAGPRGFALPAFDNDTAATVVALGYSYSLQQLGFSQVTLDLGESVACLPGAPTSIWTSIVSTETTEPWAKDAWDAAQVRDRFGLSECPAVNTCLEYPVTRTINIPGQDLNETLEPYRDGFLVTKQSGEFIYVDENEEMSDVSEFDGLPVWATAIANNGARWFAGWNGRVVTGSGGTFEELPIATTDIITGLSLSPTNERVLALAFTPSGEIPKRLTLHLLKNGRWLEVASMTDDFGTMRFTAAWDSDETAYFTYGGTQLCRLTDESVVCNTDFIDPGPVMIDDQLGVVFAARDNRLLHRQEGGWAPAGGLPFVRKPTSMLAIPGGILVGNDVGKFQQIRYDGSECPQFTTIERDANIIRENGGKIAFIGIHHGDQSPVVAIMDIPGS